MDIFKLYRYFWDYAFLNPDKIKPNHIAIYSFSIEHCNRLGWKIKFGIPTSMVMEATGIKSYSVYKKAFDDLVEYGFFEVVQYSKNQYSSNIIALKENYKALDKALDKALIKHTTKQSESTGESISSIDKPLTINNKPINNKPDNELLLRNRTQEFKESLYSFVPEYPAEMVKAFFNYWSEPTHSRKKMKFETEKTWDVSRRLAYKNFGQFGGGGKPNR